MDVQAPGTRFGAIAFLCIFAVLALLLVVGGTAEAAIPLVVVIPAALRVVMVRVWLDDDRLHVRNFWRTLDLGRPDIEFFGIEDALGGKASRRHLVFVQLRNARTRRLSATSRRYLQWPPFWPSPVRRTRADDFCDELNAWLLQSGA